MQTNTEETWVIKKSKLDKDHFNVNLLVQQNKNVGTYHIIQTDETSGTKKATHVLSDKGQLKRELIPKRPLH